MSVQVTNAGPDPDTLHVLPSAWFRNTWSWDFDAPKPELAATGPASVGVRHPFLGELELLGRAAPGGAAPTLLFCENETNDRRLYGVTASPHTPRTGSTTTSCRGRPRSTPSCGGPSAPFGTRSP